MLNCLIHRSHLSDNEHYAQVTLINIIWFLTNLSVLVILCSYFWTARVFSSPCFPSPCRKDPYPLLFCKELLIYLRLYADLFKNPSSVYLSSYVQDLPCRPKHNLLTHKYHNSHSTWRNGCKARQNVLCCIFFLLFKILALTEHEKQ